MVFAWSRDERARRTAARWVARVDHGLTAGEEGALGEWLARDPRHRVLFDRHAGLMSIAVPRASAVARARSLEQAYPEARPRVAGRGLVAAGALSLAALGVFAIVTPRLLPRDPALQMMMLSAGKIERNYRLSDGSSLTLAAASVIKVRIGRAERRAELETGRARIVVASDPRPFHVVAGNVEKEVTRGTLRASVKGGAGAVAVEPEVAPGTSVGLPSTAAHAGPLGQRALSLSNATIEFAGTRLDEAVAQVNADAGAKTLLLDPSLGSLRVTGVYRQGDMAGLARVLAATFDLDVEERGGGLIWLGRRPR